MILADKTFFGGEIFTMEKEGEKVSALVILDGKIIYAGSDDEALKFETREKVNLKGRVVLPGFNDTHIHTVTDCFMRSYIKLGDVESIDEIIEILEENKDGPEDEWIMAAGLFSDKVKEKRYPNRKELDRVKTKRPIFINSHCGHIQILNTVALKLGNVPNKDIELNEKLEYYETGEPNGIFKESSFGRYFAEIMGKQWSKTSFRIAALKDGLKEYSKVGLTSLHSVATMPDDTPIEQFNQYFELEKEGLLPQRINILPADYLPWTAGPTTGFGTEMVKLAGRKIFLDGSLGGHTAAMIEPFSDDPSNKGIMTQTREGLEKQFKEATEQGLDIAIHVIGDAAMELVLDVAEKVFPKIDEPCPYLRLKKAPRRLRIIHAMIVNDEQIKRIKKLPIILEMQPFFIDSDIQIAVDRLGEDRIDTFMPMKKFYDNGILMSGGSDAPVDPAVPLNGIQCAVTRRNLKGFPENGLVIKEALNIYQAVEIFTKNAAYCAEEENIKGTLSIGKYADFIVLDKNIFETNPEEISKIRVLKTFVGGENTWDMEA
ncbi:MAG: amidohydrolase [Clostridiales Family XIII bacterium]|jgi:predicted amidohydrolase YtcJ|nr:amidohydrolase [Clostridiales Family XIII bacterium]